MPARKTPFPPPLDHARDDNEVMTVNDFRKEFFPPLAPEDFYVLLAHASGKPKEYLLAHSEYDLDAETENRARKFFARRIAREPVAHITGEKEFYGLPFRVTRSTLIPRPETETLVERAIEEVRLTIEESDQKSEKKTLIADIGTGSGAIIISLAAELGNRKSKIVNQKSSITFHAVDISQEALVIAEENAKRNGVANMIAFHEGDLIEPLENFFHDANEIFLIANLPYLSHKLYASADTDVKKYEPSSALVSGDDGLDHYRALFASITEAISALPSYHLSVLCEISPEQDTLIIELFESLFPQEKSRIIPDLSGRSRIFSFRLDKR